MEPYRSFIGDTGGNSIEDLMNDHHTNAFANYIRAMLIIAVNDQVRLLERLHENGILASKIDHLKAIIDSAEGDPAQWPNKTTTRVDQCPPNPVTGEVLRTLTAPEAGVSFGFDITGEHFLGMANFKD